MSDPDLFRKKKGPARGKPAERFNDIFFINRELTDAEKQGLKKLWGGGEFDIWNSLDKLADEGYRISFKHDDYGDCAACFMQHVEPKHTNAGKMLTGRGRTVRSAAMELLYKHFEIFAQEWPDRENPAGYVAWDDE
jgi:hypothetical protein